MVCSLTECQSMSLKSVARGRGREGHSGSWRDNLDYSFEKTQFINPGRGCHQGKNGGGVDELSGKTRVILRRWTSALPREKNTYRAKPRP